jgi:hypothetical protein
MVFWFIWRYKKGIHYRRQRFSSVLWSSPVEAAPTERNAEGNLHQNISSKMIHVTSFNVTI